MDIHGSTARIARRLVLLAMATMVLAACGGSDPNALGPGVGGELSAEGQRQEYVDGVSRAMSQLGSATQGPAFAKAVDTGNKRQLQVAALAWRQGMQQLKSLAPPADAAAGHKNLVAAVQALDTWNQRIVTAAPNKRRTMALATQAGSSPASKQFEAAVCELVDAGYEVVDPGACGVFQDAVEAGPAG
jgi:hypothetical protein